MKILKLNLTNFRPYYGDKNKIILFDKTRNNKNFTVNIGPTGNGKTSISDAVLWCLFGETFDARWEVMVNELAIEVAEQMKNDVVKIAVEMEVEIRGENYIIQRIGEYDRINEVRKNNSKITVRKSGIPEEKPVEFINQYFLPLSLMEYFIFDADDMLRLFESNQEKTIKHHINKIVGVETLDDMAISLTNVKQLFQDDITQIQRKSPGVPKAKLDAEIQKEKIKVKAIKELYDKITEYEKQKNILFPKGKLSPEDIQLKDVMNSIHESEEGIKNINIQYEKNSLLKANVHLIFLKDIIKISMDNLRTKNTTKSEFNSAIDILKSTLTDNYSGVLIEDDGAMLIQKDIQIDDKELETVDNLTFEGGSGIKVFALPELNGFNDETIKLVKEFTYITEEYDGIYKELISSRNILKQIGKTEKNLKLKSKIDEFLKIDEKIKKVKDIIEESESDLEKIQKEIERITTKYEVTKASLKSIQSIKNKMSKIDIMLNIALQTKQEFLSNLLKEVNKEASNFFRGVRRSDDLRLYTIEVDYDYKLNVKSENNEIINPKAINKGNTQIALMAFFFGLSKFLGNELPYIIDDPLIRLDIGHDRRLIQHLSQTDQQIVMHMIPGKEYTENSYQWLKPYMNSQNWLNRKKELSLSDKHLCSYVEEKDPDLIVEFDIDSL